MKDEELKVKSEKGLVFAGMRTSAFLCPFYKNGYIAKFFSEKMVLWEKKLYLCSGNPYF